MESGRELKARRLTRAESFHVGMLVVVLFAYAGVAAFVGRFGHMPSMYLLQTIRVCGPDLGTRTWLYQDLVHETSSCEYGCVTGTRTLCQATERGEKIDHGVLTD